MEFNGKDWKDLERKNNKNTNYSHEPLVSEIHNHFQRYKALPKLKPL